MLGVCVRVWVSLLVGVVSSVLSLAYISDLWPRALVRLQVCKDALRILEDGADLVPYFPLSFRGLGI